MKGDGGLNKGLSKIIWSCFGLWILIDSLNGFVITYGIDIPVSQIFKFGIFLLVIIRMIRYDRIKLILLLTIPWFIFLWINLIEKEAGISETVTLLFKPLTTFIFFLFFVKEAKRNSYLFKKNFSKVITLNFLFLLGNVVIGVLGYGNHVYQSSDGEGGIGVKGFIYAQNEISCVVAVLYPVVLYFLHKKYSRLKYYLGCVLIMAMSFFIGTKASLLVALLSTVVLSYYLGTKKEKKIVFWGTAIVGILGVSYLSYLLASDIGFLQRFMYFYEERGLAEALLSGRWGFWQNYKTVFENSDLLSHFFGLGIPQATCELDPFDALLNFGYVGFTINLIYLYCLFTIPLRNKKKGDYEKSLVISNLLLVFISIFSGHIFFSSMGGLFVALSNAPLYAYYKKTVNF